MPRNKMIQIQKGNLLLYVESLNNPCVVVKLSLGILKSFGISELLRPPKMTPVNTIQFFFFWGAFSDSKKKKKNSKFKALFSPNFPLLVLVDDCAFVPHSMVKRKLT